MRILEKGEKERKTCKNREIVKGNLGLNSIRWRGLNLLEPVPGYLLSKNTAITFIGDANEERITNFCFLFFTKRNENSFIF